MRFVSFLIFVFLPTYAFTQEYAVDLSPVFKKGAVFQYSIQTEVIVDHGSSLGGVAVESIKFSFKAECSGKLSVIDVTPKGLIAAFSFKVELFKLKEAKGVTINLKAGDTIECELDPMGETVYKINGIEPKKEDKDILGELIAVQDDDMPSDQECFGTKLPVKVGAKWEINKKVALSSMGELGAKNIEAIKLEGGFQLDKVEPFNKVNSLFVSCNIKFSGISPELPPEVTVSESFISIKGNKVIPIEKGIIRPIDNLEMVTKIIAGGKLKAENVEKEILVKIFKSTKSEKRWSDVPTK